MFQVEDLLHNDLSPLNKIVLEAGAKGLEREISWPNTIMTVPISQWLLPGEMVIISGVGLNISEVQMLKMVDDAFEGDAGCLVFMLSDEHITEIPDNVKQKADELNMPVLTIPWEVPLGLLMSKVSELIISANQRERLKTQFVLELFSPNPDEEICYQHAELMGINLNNSNRVLLLKILNLKEILERHGIKDENIIYHYKSRYGIAAENYWKQQEVNCTWAFQKETLILICELGGFSEAELSIALDAFIRHMKGIYGDILYKLGVSECCTKVKDYLKAMREARTAIDANRSGNPVCLFKHVGIMQILMLNTNANQLKGLYEETFSHLLEADITGELMQTLEVYIENNGNILQSSKDLYIHRNTLQNRLLRIEKLLQTDLDDAYVRNNLLNAILVGRFLK